MNWKIKHHLQVQLNIMAKNRGMVGDRSLVAVLALFHPGKLWFVNTWIIHSVTADTNTLLLMERRTKTGKIAPLIGNQGIQGM